MFAFLPAIALLTGICSRERTIPRQIALHAGKHGLLRNPPCCGRYSLCDYDFFAIKAPHAPPGADMLTSQHQSRPVHPLSGASLRLTGPSMTCFVFPSLSRNRISYRNFCKLVFRRRRNVMSANIALSGMMVVFFTQCILPWELFIPYSAQNRSLLPSIANSRWRHDRD